MISKNICSLFLCTHFSISACNFFFVLHAPDDVEWHSLKARDRIISDLNKILKCTLLHFGSIFFKMDCVKIHKTLPSTTYIKLSKIWQTQLSRFGRGLYGMAFIKIILTDQSMYYIDKRQICFSTDYSYVSFIDKKCNQCHIR